MSSQSPTSQKQSTKTQASLLDSVTALRQLDSTNVLGSIEQLANQVQSIWDSAQNIEAPAEYSHPHQIVVCGMGGSVLGTDIITSLFADQLPCPVTVVPEYEVPAFVNEKTLVIASSYSGGTEETWSALQGAVARKAMIAGVTSGGKIGDFLQANHYPHLIFETSHNPSGIAKMGLGYSIFGQMMLFAKLGLLTITEEHLTEIIESIANAHLKMSVGIEQEANPAKLLAYELVDHLPFLIAAEHLNGVVHACTNQLNENAKTLAEYHLLPELNHHLLEGLAHPTPAKGDLMFVTIHSGLYRSEISARLKLTEECLEQESLNYTQYHLTEKTPLGQAFELLMLGAYSAFYLSMLYGIDPGPIPTVEWFKSELKNRASSSEE